MLFISVKLVDGRGKQKIIRKEFANVRSQT